MARAKRCTPSQLALAWVLAQGSDIIPIPGTKKAKYLDENLEAINFSLTREELARIEGILPPGATAGDRYPPHAMRVIDH